MVNLADQKSAVAEKKKGKAGLAALIFVFSAVLIGMVILLLNKNKEVDDLRKNQMNGSGNEKRIAVVNESNVDEVLQEIVEEEKIPAGSYEVVMNTTWNFKDGQSSSSDAYVENSTANTNDVYFDVYLADSGENIYKSPLIPVGEYVEYFQLDKSLAAGTYDCVVVYSLVDEEQEVLSTVQVASKINIEN